MKTQLIIIALLFTTLSCKAQSPVINQTTYDVDQRQDGMYLKDIDNILGRFVGTWKWIDGNSSFEIVFTKGEMVEFPYGTYYDIIIGTYKYIRNGILIVDNLSQSYQGYAYPISGGFEQTNHNRLNVGVIDYIKHKNATGYFELLSGTSPEQAKWYVQGHGRILVDGEPSNQGFTLPSYEEIILVKQ